MISNIEYKHNSEEIISLTNSHNVHLWIGKNTNVGVITGFKDGRMYSGELQNLRVEGSVYAKFGEITWNVNMIFPNTKGRRILLLKK